MAFIGNQPTAVPLTSSQLADGLVTTAKLATDAVTTAKLASTSVTNAKVDAAAITTDKLDLISTASVPAVTAKGTSGVTDGYIQLNCEQNSHGIKLKSPPHSAAATYTMVMPNSLGTASQVLRMNSGATALEFATPASGSNVFLASTGAGSAVSSADLNGYFSSTYDIYEIFIVNCIASSDQTLKLRFATTGSYTVQTGNDYNTSQNYNYDNSTGLSANGYSSTSAYQIVHIGSSTNFSTTSKIILFKPTSTSQKKNIHSFTLGNYSGTRYFTNAAGYWNSTTAVTGVRILPDSGTITYDNIYLYGIKNS